MIDLLQPHALTNVNIPIVILCGGKSSRMKTDKSLLPFCGYHSLTHYQFERLSKEFSSVYVSSKEDKFNFPMKKEQLILDEINETYSPMVALKTVLQSIKQQEIFILTVDTPFISLQTIKKLMNKHNAHDITIAATKDKGHHLCGVFSKRILETIEHMLMTDIHKIGYLLKEVKSQTILFEDKQEFMNLNTQDDYKEALQYISLTNK